ncbi:S1C family serine protease [Arthrobacter sp. H14-L1]|uniref:S1C family serine protease n=1 Tax=Arthrobacter sp. H14-L1 TaxID=2996697 RepID=UPI00226E092D|nr:trypsin-like peptidase domain-containing protein [Arthrobacter sp. H14-L1]MCY0905168.1 trypsin-like peptidase domain-containing protein [Arthrobacter sp. H14-L1]
MRMYLRFVGAVVLSSATLVTATGCTGSPAASQPSASQSASNASSAPGGATSSSASSSASAGGTAGAGLPAVPGIVKTVEPSVVTIMSSIGLGSGVVYRADGTIVTDAHVVEDQQKKPFSTVQVQFADGTQVQADVMAVDDVSDVAVIKAHRSNLPAATFSTVVPEVGSLAVVLGSPLGLADTVTAGIISALHRNMPPSTETPQGITDLIQTDAPISPGNSGGAVVNGNSEIIGLSEAYLPPSSGAVAIGFVTPATTVTEVADQLLANGKVRHAALGVVPTDISPQVAQHFNIAVTEGALVLDVPKGGPAAAAGIHPGDIIVSFAGKKISNALDLTAAIRQKEPGDQVDVVVLRGKDTQTLRVTLGNNAQ